MSWYRRATTAGATYFFTIVTYRRQPILCEPLFRRELRREIETVRVKRPFVIDAWVLLPDHLHCVWTLPPGDSDYSARWAMIKRHVSLACAAQYKRPEWIAGSRRRHRESTIWQRRFWEHRIRDPQDLARHVDYVHLNPVKHGLVERVVDWTWSTFHSYRRRGDYPEEWCAGGVSVEKGEYGE
ncbi:MAG: transposase [Sedimenticola sp.]|nr:transposase [Sedimenticola sp.]